MTIYMKYAFSGSSERLVVIFARNYERPKEPLHIKVPPPRVLKAKRAMKEVRSARDPEYKTLELDISEWESAKIMRKSELHMDEIDRKEYKLQTTQ
ncbi:hypothetical protein ANCCAN_28508 [Ancylostoma caninum]|uniref:Uncharacterized protein n=1 Tax=Ancylostoma caninum TaxID=29170 RepID=A0A368F6G2_ANCCA|nr:hypothetical protein ANCCAN_28508 [Ancylostoma caninum]